MSKRNLIKKTLQVGSLTMLSRAFGLLRDILQAWFLGIGAQSDAFLTAFRIPNLFRQIFAEGALSAALIPHLTKMVHDRREKAVGSLLSTTALLLGGIVGVLCIAIMIWPSFLITLFAPGFRPDQAAFATKYLSIMFPFIFFVSMCAVLTAALQAIDHFLAPALAPIFFNLTLIVALVAGITFNLPVSWLCYAVLASGIAKLIPRIIAFKHLGLSFGPLSYSAWQDTKTVLKRLGPCLAGVGVYHINVLLDTVVGSFLPHGQLTMLHYSYRFMHAPMAILGIAISTTFLPYFSRIALTDKKHLSLCITEVAKLLFWLVLPITLFFILNSRLMFEVLFSHMASSEQLMMAGKMLAILSVGLFVLSLNRVLIKLFYALHNTKTPTWIVAMATALKIGGNIFSITIYGGVYGIVTATVVADLLTTPALFIALIFKHRLSLQIDKFMLFLKRFIPQLLGGALLFFATQKLAVEGLKMLLTPGSKTFLACKLMMSSTIFACFMLAMFIARNKTKMELYFLEN